MSTEIAQRTPQQKLVAQIRSDESRAQIAAALEGTGVPAVRFVRVAITAINENPELVTADRASLLTALVKCAQDGLLPDGREAAFVLFGKKATYMPMIGGFRKIAAEHGWSLFTAVVYANDTFDYQLGEKPELTHKPTRLGEDRGAPIGAYAIAEHRDGRRMLEVMDAAEIGRVRATSKSKDRGPWVEWPDRMAEKTAGRRLFKQLPLDERDRERVQRVLEAAEFGDPARAIYGRGNAGAGTAPVPSSAQLSAAGEAPAGAAPTPGPEGDGATSEDDEGEPAPQSGSPSDDDDPEPLIGEVMHESDDEAFEAAAAVAVPKGELQGTKLGDLTAPDCAAWFGWAVGRKPGYWPADFAVALEVFAERAFPDVFAEARGS